MRRLVLGIVSTVSGLVMLFSYHTSTMGAGTTTTGGSAGGAAGGAAVDPGSSSRGTVTGGAVATRWGPVQVQITVSNGKITQATAVAYPNSNGRDQQINAYALPVLAQEAVVAQSAQIDHVSGATVTSDGYVASLQSAIDQANL
jgi:uncharacterized protein with FMN-binding domain